MTVKESDLYFGPFPAESKADLKRMEQVVPLFRQLVFGLKDLTKQHEKVHADFIKERQEAGEPINNNSAQVELCLRLEACTKSCDEGVQALYAAFNVLRLIGRRELMVAAHWAHVYQNSKNYEKKGKLTATESIDAIVAVKKLRESEPKLLDELEQNLIKALNGNDPGAKQSAQMFLEKLPLLREVLNNPRSSSCISSGLKWLKDL